MVRPRRIHSAPVSDLEMIKSVGYSRHRELLASLLRRLPANLLQPSRLLPRDFLSSSTNLTSPSPTHGMWHGDRSRKPTSRLRLSFASAMDNRPLQFEEFENRTGQIIYVSATPGPYELTKSAGVSSSRSFVHRLIDPPVEIPSDQRPDRRPPAEIRERAAKNERSSSPHLPTYV